MRLNSFGSVQHLLSVLVMFFFGVIIGLAIVPSYFLFDWLTSFTKEQNSVIEAIGTCIALGLGYIVWGICLIII